MLSDEPAEEILKISEIINRNLNEISSRVPNLNSKQVAVFALLNTLLEKNKVEESLKIYKQKEAELLKVVEQTNSIL